MALKRKFATFISNWYGVIIATIIVAFSATFGGMYLYAHNRIVNATNFATQGLSLPRENWLVFQPEVSTENPLSFVYQLRLNTYHPHEGIIIDVTISNLILMADNHVFEVAQDGLWEQSVSGGIANYVIYKGNITIDKEIFDDLQTKGSVTIVVQGEISGSGSYRWASQTISLPFNISAEATFSYVED